MKKDNGIWMILLLAGAFLLAGQRFSLFGFTTLQASEINFISHDPFLNGKVWSITLVPGGMSQWIEGVTAEANIPHTQFSDGGYSAERDLKIDITKHQERCQYSTQPTGMTPIGSFGYAKYKKTLLGFGPCPSNMLDDCKTKGEPIAAGPIADPILETECVCIYANVVEPVVTSLSAPSRKYETEITINNGQDTQSVTLTNPGVTEAQIGDVARVKVIGLASTNPCPSSSDYLVAGSGNNWKLISRQAYDRYLNMLDDLKSTTLVVGEDAVKQLVDNANRYADIARTEVEWCLPTGGCATNDANIWAIKPTVPITNNIIQMYVKADWLGVVQPVGEPRITCDYLTEIGSGGGAIKATVSNIGSGRGNVEVWADCEYPVTQDGGNVEFALEPAESRTASIWVGASKVNEPTTVNCIMNARIGTNIDSCVARVRVNPDKICPPYKKTCRNDAIMQCNQYGTEWGTLEACEGSAICQFVNGVPTCVTADAPATPPKFPMWILVVVVLVIGGGIFLWRKIT